MVRRATGGKTRPKQQARRSAKRSAPLAIPQLTARPETVHWGFYSAELKAILTVPSGARLRVTDAVRPDPAVLEAAGVPARALPEGSRRIWREMKPQVGRHILVGPVAVEGAEPGGTLEVRFESIEVAVPAAVNMQKRGEGLLPDEFPEEWLRVIRFDTKRKVARIAPGITVPLSPYFGNIGVAPDPALGRVSSMPPGRHGGNLDLKELTAGSTLYLPVRVPGALFSVGDGHAAQGDGEVDLSALEGALTGVIQLVLRRDLRIEWPMAETPSHIVTMGFDADLDRAAQMAVREMIAYLTRTQPLTRQEAYMLCSVGVDLHVTQVVNGVKGIHAMLPKRLFRRPPTLRKTGR